MMEMAVPGKRKRERPRRRGMDLASEDMERVGVEEGDEIDRNKWKILSCVATPNREKPKEEEEYQNNIF